MIKILLVYLFLFLLQIQWQDKQANDLHLEHFVPEEWRCTFRVKSMDGRSTDVKCLLLVSTVIGGYGALGQSRLKDKITFSG